MSQLVGKPGDVDQGDTVRGVAELLLNLDGLGDLVAGDADGVAGPTEAVDHAFAGFERARRGLVVERVPVLAGVQQSDLIHALRVGARQHPVDRGVRR